MNRCQRCDMTMNSWRRYCRSCNQIVNREQAQRTQMRAETNNGFESFTPCGTTHSTLVTFIQPYREDCDTNEPNLGGIRIPTDSSYGCDSSASGGSSE